MRFRCPSWVLWLNSNSRVVAVACGLGFVPCHLGVGTSDAVALDTGMDGEKGGPGPCAQQAEKLILDEAGLSPAHFFCKSGIHLFPSAFTRVQFYTEIVSKS